MSILVGAEMAFTVIEWVLFIAVVGVKVPPGGNPAEAKRWARGLADDPHYQRGADAQTQGMSRSASARSGIYSKSPGAAELGGPHRHSEAIEDEDADGRDEEGDEEAEGSDPDDIIDITPNRAVARKEARLRLARAALPERRASGGTLSTLNIFGGGGGGSGDTSSARCGDGEARGPNVFSDEAGSPVARNSRQDPNSAALLPVMRDATGSADTSMQTSTSMTFPSSSSTRTVSTQSSSIKSKMKLPRWLKRSKKK
uniref:Uncharacterized protein n=1 Tax=Kalmanozyma brasiliensis (strain GHG001) TaxID=1365824 RepID=V5EVK3_KALBG